jgi:pimeloyl-ACP methyl ester carboxylesterase
VIKYETHFCTSADGTRIAYAVALGQVPAVVIVPGWPGTIELVASDIAPHPLLGNYATVWFDRRGLGISQRRVDDISLERQVEDLAAVVDDYGTGPINVYASWDGTPIALAYAALHPKRCCAWRWSAHTPEAKTSSREGPFNRQWKWHARTGP